jgi:hypothetical protein
VRRGAQQLECGPLGVRRRRGGAGVVVIGHDRGALDEHQQLPCKALRVLGLRADGDAGEQREIAVQVAGGDGAGGIGVVLCRRVDDGAAAEARLGVPRAERVEDGRQLRRRVGAGVAFAAVLPLLGLAPATVGASALLFGSTFMMVPAPVTAFVSTPRPAGDRTGTLAALTVVFAAGQSAGPWVSGLLADRTSAGAVLGWAAVLCAVAALLAITQPAGRDGAPESR